MIIQFCSGNDNLKAEILESARGPIVIFCHGFPGRNLHLLLGRELEERGIGSIVFRYRGVDGQAGRYNLLEQERDIQALIETVRRKNEFRRPLALLGYSMGGVHVVRLLANEPRIADAQEDELLEQLEAT